MSKPAVPRDAKRAYLLVVVCFALFSVAATMYEVNLPNFLRDHLGVGEWFRGFLELPRESQGFAVLFYVVFLGALTERRIFSLAAVVAAVGLVGMALLPTAQLPDGLRGIVPGLPLILVVMVFSAGMHLAMVLQPTG